jgi:hypothetical protein
LIAQEYHGSVAARDIRAYDRPAHCAGAYARSCGVPAGANAQVQAMDDTETRERRTGRTA